MERRSPDVEQGGEAAEDRNGFLFHPWRCICLKNVTSHFEGVDQKNENLKNFGSFRGKIITNLFGWVPEAPQD